MAMISTIVAVAALTISAVSAYNAYENGKDMKKASKRSYEQQLLAQKEQRKVNEEGRAMNAQAQANEKRNMIREERVRRAKIMQAAENTGASDSSGLAGATGSMGTQLGSALGSNLSAVASSNRVSGYNNNISIFNQNAAGFNFQAQQASIDKQNNEALFGLGMSMFSSAGGFGAFNSPSTAPSGGVSQG